MERLKSTNELTIKSTNRYSIITICNYDSYQLSEDDNNQQANQPNPNKQPATNQQLTTTKKLKKDKELKEFKEDVRSFKEKYNSEMLEAFIRYWTEENKSGTKMRFQLQQTWSTSGRLATWNKRDYNKLGKKNLYEGYVDSSFD